jgi:predicted GH43/DUF377 family glycosyl hydrolase
MRYLKFLMFFASLYGGVIEDGLALTQQEQVVVATKKMTIEGFPGAHNPSIFEIDQGFLLTFRVISDLSDQPWLSYIGVVVLNEAFEQITSPQLLDVRKMGDQNPSQAEDARIFSYRGRIFLIYNDCLDEIFDSGQRRDMVIAELFYENGRFSLSLPLKLFHAEKYPHVLCQKNWVPFEYNKQLFMGYSIFPHEVLKVNWATGACVRAYETTADIVWSWGPLRGSSAPQLIDGEYFAFFHSGTVIASSVSQGHNCWHYFMGAYTFAAEPPFNLTSWSKLPIIADEFYAHSTYYKKVVFPGGFVAKGPFFYVAYSKDDSEIWIATLDKEALKRTMK